MCRQEPHTEARIGKHSASAIGTGRVKTAEIPQFQSIDDPLRSSVTFS